MPTKQLHERSRPTHPPTPTELRLDAGIQATYPRRASNTAPSGHLDSAERDTHYPPCPAPHGCSKIMKTG